MSHFYVFCYNDSDPRDYIGIYKNDGCMYLYNSHKWCHAKEFTKKCRFPWLSYLCGTFLHNTKFIIKGSGCKKFQYRAQVPRMHSYLRCITKIQNPQTWVREIWQNPVIKANGVIFLLSRSPTHRRKISMDKFLGFLGKSWGEIFGAFLINSTLLCTFEDEKMFLFG